MDARDMIRSELQRIEPGLEIGAANGIWAEAYEYVERHAMDRRLWNTVLALPLVQKMIFVTGGKADSPFEDTVTKLRHGLSVCRILIDLHVPVNPRDEDILLSAALCHILPLDCELFRRQGVLDPEVIRMVTIMRRGATDSDEKLAQYIRQIRENRLVLLLCLADRSNLAEQLHNFSTWSTRRYIHETRSFYLPVCIYAKEYYPELMAPVSLLMEKMRSLIEVAEILLTRYEEVEDELIRDILQLEEENAMIKGILRTYEQQER